MNLDELRSVQNKERQKDSLQHLRESFYEDVADYVQGLESERDRAAEESEDPFASPEVRQLTDEIETAKEVTRAIYERRLGKLVKRASLAAADMPADEEGLTAEERDLFADLVDRMERNKTRVLDVLDGEAERSGSEPSSTGVSNSPGTDPESQVGSGRSPDEAAPQREGAPQAEETAPSADQPTGPSPGSTDPERPGAEEAAEVAGHDEAADPGDFAGSEGGDGAGSGDPDGPATDGGAAGPASRGLDDRTTVRITSDVGEILGVDQREYDLAAEEVVTLPAENADPLLERDAAVQVTREE